MSEQSAEKGATTVSATVAAAVAAPATVTTSPSKPIIITKSIKLNEPSTPIVTKTGDQENLDTSTDKDASKVDLKALTPEQKLEMRIKKFGVQSENAKLTSRAQRFGASASGGVVDESKMNKRAERFGLNNSATDAPGTPVVSADVLEKRQKRFGVGTESNGSASTANSETSEALLKRKERFGVVNEDDKKKLRSQRFETKA